MEQSSVLQRVRDAAAARNMTFQEYLRYAQKAENDLSPDEQWDAATVSSAVNKWQKIVKYTNPQQSSHH